MKKGWQTQTIGALCDLATGGTPSRTKPEYFGGDIKWLVSGDINQGEIFDCEGRITEAGMKNSNAKLLPVNSVMIALNGQGKTRGTVALLRTEATCNQSMVSISPRQSSGLLPEFLYANLHSRYEEIRRMTSDDDKDRRGLNMGLIRSIKIPVIPLAEQHRIVALLDEAFAGLDTAQANAEKNLQNARALFESFLNAVYVRSGSESWPKRRLGDVFEIGSSKRIHERDWSPSGVPFYGGKEIVKLAKHGYTVSNAYISEKKYEEFASRSDMPKAGDILITARGTIGVGYVVQKSDKFYYKDGNIISMRAKEPTNPHYLLYAFRSDALADQLGELSGATVRHLPLEKAKELLLRIPKVDVQNAIVGRTKEFEGKIQRLESLYQQKQAALATLKRSLLHQAFAGRL